IRKYAEAICVKRHFGRWSEPHIPIEALWRIAVGQISDTVRMLIAEVPGSHKADLADLSASDDVNRFLKMDARALLCSHLHHSIVLSRRLHHLAALIDCQ